MKKIYKYKFHITDDFTIDLPIEHQILDVQVQDAKPTMWVLLNPDDKPTSTNFCLIGTGNPIDRNMDDYIYIGTFQHGPFVWHLFKLIRERPNYCPKCGYPRFKHFHEDFERCEGCDWTSLDEIEPKETK